MLVLYSQNQDEAMLGGGSETSPCQVSMCTFFDKVKSAMMARWEIEIVKKSSHLLKFSSSNK